VFLFPAKQQRQSATMSRCYNNTTSNAYYKAAVLLPVAMSARRARHFEEEVARALQIGGETNACQDGLHVAMPSSLFCSRGQPDDKGRWLAAALAELRGSRRHEHTVGVIKGNYREALPLKAHDAVIRPALVVRSEEPSRSTQRSLCRTGRVEREPPARPVADGEDCHMYTCPRRSAEGGRPTRQISVRTQHEEGQAAARVLLHVRKVRDTRGGAAAAAPVLVSLCTRGQQA
jgi:hypothetical protein